MVAGPILTNYYRMLLARSCTYTKTNDFFIYSILLFFFCPIRLGRNKLGKKVTPGFSSVKLRQRFRKLSAFIDHTRYRFWLMLSPSRVVYFIFITVKGYVCISFTRIPFFKALLSHNIVCILLYLYGYLNVCQTSVKFISIHHLSRFHLGTNTFVACFKPFIKERGEG